MYYTPYWPTILTLFSGILLIVVGYTLRRRNLGVWLLWLGQITVIALILFHIVRAVAG